MTRSAKPAPLHGGNLAAAGSARQRTAQRCRSANVVCSSRRAPWEAASVATDARRSECGDMAARPRGPKSALCSPSRLLRLLRSACAVSARIGAALRRVTTLRAAGRGGGGGCGCCCRGCSGAPPATCQGEERVQQHSTAVNEPDAHAVCRTRTQRARGPAARVFTAACVA
jgi:hypothetical protein